jgi:nucleotide-binding universal stress UspA family protein
MFRSIVLALDGSEGSQRAIPLAAELAKRDQAKLVIAHVEQDVVGKGGGPVPATEDEIQAEVRRHAKELSDLGIETSVRDSPPPVTGASTDVARARRRLAL